MAAPTIYEGLPTLTPIDVIRKRARESRDDQYYDKLYTLKRFLAGDQQAITDALNGYMRSYSGDADLGDYPEIELLLGPQSVQNHGLLSSRINIQAIVYADPEFRCITDEPLLRDVNNSYFRYTWEKGDWGNIFYEVGMDVEACGIGFAQLGINDQELCLIRRDPLDMLWDHANRSPGQWRFYFARARLDLEQAKEKYGHLISEDRLLQLSRQIRTGDVGYFNAAQLGSRYGVYGSARYIHEWEYWDGDTHCVFLGSIQGDCEYLGYDADLNYQLGTIGPNPMGCLPFCVWVDSWSPGVKRPVGKAETTWRTATMLNAIELYVKETIKRGVPINLMSSFGLRPDQIKTIQEAQGIEDINKIILLDIPNVKEAMARSDPLDIPEFILKVRDNLKQELNAATGVADAQKGAPLPGDKTAYEVRALTQAQGVQARHTRRQFSKFLQQVASKGRWIGALYDTANKTLYIPDGVLDTRVIPLKPFLKAPMQILVEENSLQYQTNEDVQNRRLMQFQTVDVLAIQYGVGSADKIFRDVYRVLGKRDPDQLMYSANEQAMRQQAQAAQQAGAGGGADPNDPTGQQATTMTDRAEMTQNRFLRGQGIPDHTQGMYK